MSKPIIGIGSDVQEGKDGERDRAWAYTTYVESLRRAGAIPVVIPPQPENAAEIAETLDGILLAGGDDCDPALYGEDRHSSVTSVLGERRTTNDLSLAKVARERGIPTLGICLGMQMMNVAGGGSLVQDIDSQVTTNIQHASIPEDRARHEVMVEQGTRLAGIVPAVELNVNSSHHQAIGRVAEGLRVTAHAPDGIVEGLEDPRHPFYVGVQWHPEDMTGEGSAGALFGAFIEAARRYSRLKQQATVLSPAGGDRSE
ncbi:MAG TPA: gamma-glutamyl-gamma-aminobutyrate hydrolase family protein [Thermoanaerobaculia bacterium]|nr:gamma-glutamyl-gamma-aminobutyrate hydrolase family protein [Thermoanaerobaculia bacterium]